MMISSVRSRVADVPQRPLLSAAGVAAAAVAIYCYYNKRGDGVKTTANPEDTTGLQDPVCEQAPEPALVQPSKVLQDQLTDFLTEAEEKQQTSVETITQLEKEKSNLINQVEKLTEKVENMKNNLCTAYSECDEFMKEFVRERKAYRLQSDYRKKEKSLIYQDKILTVSLANAKKQKRNTVKTMIQLEEEKRNLTIQLKKLRGTLENMKYNLFKMNREHDELMDKCVRERGAYSILHADNDKMKKTLIHQEELPKDSLAEATKKHQKSVETINELKEKKSTLTNQMERLSQNVEVMKNNLFKAFSEDDELMKVTEKVSAKYMRKQKLYSALQSDDNKIQKTLLYQDKFLKDEAKEKHQKAVKTVTQLVNETSKQTNHVEELRGTLEKMKNDLFKSNSERDELMDVSLAKPKKKHHKAVEAIAQLEKEKSKLTKHFESLRRTVEDMKDELFVTHRECNELMGECGQQQKARSVLQSEKMHKPDIQKVENKKKTGAYGDHCSLFMSEV